MPAQPSRSETRLLVTLCTFTLAGLLGAALPAAASVPNFSNGQSATIVLGQPDFSGKEVGGGREGMNSPSGVAVDPVSGKIFVADSFNHRVLRFASLGALSSGAQAEAVLGQTSFSGRTSGTGPNRMADPYGIVVDSAGRLWVSETDNNRVLRFDDAANKPTGANADGVLGQPNFTSNTRAAARNKMSDPNGLAIDSAGRLWVTDTFNNRILRFDNAAAKPNGADADGVLGQPNFTSVLTGVLASRTVLPGDVAVDGSGTLWVADSQQNRVLRFDNAAAKPNGADADGVLGQPNFTSTTPVTNPATVSSLTLPLGLALDSAGRLWVADTTNDRILRFDNAAAKPNGAPADGVLGQTTFTGNQGGTTDDKLGAPHDVAVDSAGRVFVADFGNHRVMIFGPLPSSISASFAPVTPSPRPDPVASLALSFSAPVTGVDLADFTLVRNGTPVSLSGAGLLGSGAGYTLTNLSGLTQTDGTYTLTLRASGSGIQSSDGKALESNAQVSWTVSANTLSAAFEPVTPALRATPVVSLTLNFSAPVTGVDIADFVLSYNGVQAPLTGMSLSGSGSRYILSSGSSPLAASGAYTLTLRASGSGIQSSDGKALGGDATVSWTITAQEADDVMLPLILR